MASFRRGSGQEAASVRESVNEAFPSPSRESLEDTNRVLTLLSLEQHKRSNQRSLTQPEERVNRQHSRVSKCTTTQQYYLNEDTQSVIRDRSITHSLRR